MVWRPGWWVPCLWFEGILRVATLLPQFRVILFLQYARGQVIAPFGRLHRVATGYRQNGV